MHIIIEDKTIRENLRKFIAELKRAEAKREKMGAAWMDGGYPAFLHRVSGHLYFIDTYKGQEQFDSSEYKMLVLDYSYDPHTASLEAVVYEIDGKERAFELHQLSPLAIHAIQETIHWINKLSSLLKGSSSDIIVKIQDLCKLQIDESEEKNVLTSAWHSVDRLGAESLLKGHPIGTYLFREDFFAKLLGEQLTEQLGKSVKCITLSILEPGNKVTEFTLVHVDHTWRCYDNVLFCNVKGFADLKMLINECFKDRARFVLAPLMTHEQRRLA